MVQEYFDQAELALASYADFANNVIDVRGINGVSRGINGVRVNFR